MKKVLFLFWTFTALFAANAPLLHAQSLEPFNPYAMYSPSVDAWQMTRYGNLTPSLYTGAMTFSLPLYTYEDPDFSIPISLEYSFEGYRPAQHSGVVGYGWWLNCGGVITREVRGIPDEGRYEDTGLVDYPTVGWRQAGTFRDTFWQYAGNIRSLNSARAAGTYAELVSGRLYGYDTFSDIPMYKGYEDGHYYLYDTAPDLYRFNFLGHSGEFVMLPDGTVRVFNSDIPYGQVSVSFADGLNVNDCTYVEITITTGDGYSYLFTTADKTTSVSLEVSPSFSPRSTMPVSVSASTYRLSRITAPNGRTVDFSYCSMNTEGVTRVYGPTGEVDYSVAVPGQPDIIDTYQVFPTVPWSVTQETVSSLSGISVSGCGTQAPAASILFSYSSAPGDEFSSSCFESIYASLGYPGEQYVLTGISISNASGANVDEFSLSYVRPGYGTPKSFLQSVSGMRIGRHSFEYNLFGYVLPKNDTESIDHWGFWNGASVSGLTAHLADCIPNHAAATHLYDQVVDGVKEASFYYSSCGALTQITYPTGGTTQIGYEANSVRRRLNSHFSSGAVTLEPADSSNAYATWTVGGVRVKSLTDSDFSGDVRRTSFTYADYQNHASGILMQMPRYCQPVSYTHSASGYSGNTGLSYNSTANVVGYSNACGFVLSADPQVCYTDVTVQHPDGSRTRYSFSSVSDASLRDVRPSAGGGPFTKHIYGPEDSITASTGADSHSALVPISLDRSRMRGKPLSEETFDASGNQQHRVDYCYATDTMQGGHLCYNNAVSYYLTTYTAESPLLQVRTESSHGLVTESRYSYNTFVQKTVELVSSYPEPAGTDAYLAADTTRTTYTYLHESVDTTSLSAVIASATKVRIAGGVQTVVAAEDYAYGQWSAAGNPKPTLLRRLLPDGSVRSTSVSYDALFRPTALVRNPGGASISYTWDGTQLSSRTDNSAGNTSSFSWKALVGPTLITAPSGQSTAYGYDTRNRLFLITDDAGSAVTKYSYKLINE